MKTCSRCRVEKQRPDFGKHARAKDGLRSECRACRTLELAATKDVVSGRNKAYYAVNADRERVRHAAYYAANREARGAHAATYRAANSGKVSASLARYRAENKEKRAASWALYYVENREALRAKDVAYRAAHPEVGRWHCQRRRALLTSAAGPPLPKDIEQRLFAKQNGLCACCFADLSETGHHLDHIIALAKGGTHSEDNVQLLSPKCNMSKGSKDWIEYLNSRPRIQAATVTYRRAS